MKNKWFIGTLLFCVGCSNGLGFGVNPVEIDDEYPPYISLGTYEFQTVVGQPIDFSNINAYDDVDGLVKVEVEGDIDYNTPGEYYPSLISRDTSGNTTEITITVTVKETLETTPDIEQVEEEVIEVETSCANSKAQNPEAPCDVVLSEQIEEDIELYYGSKGKDLCEERLEENEECHVIVRNDGSYWGYGKRRLSE